MNHPIFHIVLCRCLREVKRPCIWLCRFRHRRGYGVHSPFAFGFIKEVIFQHAPYYKYEALRRQERELARRQGRQVLYETLRVRRLLFRVANEVRPDTIVDAGTLAASALYLKAAREEATYTGAAELDELFLEAGVPVDLLYVHDYRRPAFVEEVFRLCAPRTTERSVFIVEGIRYTRPMRELWRRMQADERVGVTFDLYDLGILFFDHSRPKQHYIVNF